MTTKTLPPQTENPELTLEDVAPLDGRRIAIVGPSGAGKTWLAATWPDPAFLDLDRNIGTLKQSGWRQYAGVPNGKQIRVAYADDVKDKRGLVISQVGFWQAMEKLNEWSERPDIKTIVIDSMTALGKVAMSLGVHLAGEDKRSQTEKEAKKHGVMLMTQADFGAEMNVMEQLLDQVPMIEGKTIIFNCHMRTERNNKGALLGYSPLITGDKHRATFGRWFNEVWWLEVKGSGQNAKRVLQTQQDNLHPFVKTTMGLPMEIENPTYTKVMKLAERAA